MPRFPELNRDKALVFRIVHRDNVPWILDHGLHCSASPRQNPAYVAIGDPELTAKRKRRPVPLPPGGTLEEYVPFYFTPRSPMLHKILTGRGVTKRDPRELVIITMPLPAIAAAGVPFVFTDGHAYGYTTRFFNELHDLDRIDWEILQRSDFKTSVDDPGKVSRYQAEALVYGGCRLDPLGALACYDAEVKEAVERWVRKRGSEIKVFVRSAWFPL